MTINVLGTDKYSIIRSINDEKGSALIIAILLLALMTVFGTVLMSTSTTEIQLSGNYRNTQESFYTADRAIAYAMQRASGGLGRVDLFNDQDNTVAPAVLHRNRIAVGRSGLEASVLSAVDDRNSVIYLREWSPPVGSGNGAVQFDARNYIVSTVGVFPLNTTSPSRTVLRSQFAKIVPR